LHIQFYRHKLDICPFRIGENFVIRRVVLSLLLLLGASSCAWCADSLSVPRVKNEPTALPVTHVLRKQYLLTEQNSNSGKWVTESKFKDTAGKTVATAKTVGNLTTHKDPDGRLLGYSVVVNGHTMNYDARGRVIK
jgi:hypothetical protein